MFKTRIKLGSLSDNESSTSKLCRHLRSRCMTNERTGRVYTQWCVLCHKICILKNAGCHNLIKHLATTYMSGTKCSECMFSLILIVNSNYFDIILLFICFLLIPFSFAFLFQNVEFPTILNSHVGDLNEQNKVEPVLLTTMLSTKVFQSSLI